jgi:hypothetical protein
LVGLLRRVASSWPAVLHVFVQLGHGRDFGIKLGAGIDSQSLVAMDMSFDRR